MLTLLPTGLELLVNSTTANHQRDPAIAMDADGDFVIAWAGYYGTNDFMDGVYVQRYKSDGTALGPETLVNTFTVNNQNQVSVAMSNSGSFVVAWTSDGQDGDSTGIYAKRFNADGVAVGSEFAINTYTTGAQFAPSIGMDDGGNFVVSWTSSGQDGSDFGIFARRFDANGVAVTGEISVNTYTPRNQQASTVAMDDNGNFVVAWESYGQENTDFATYRYGVYARRYDVSGAPQGTEFLVNVGTTNDQRAPSVAMDPSGNFVVAFQTYFDGSSEGILFRRFDAAGAAQGGDVMATSPVSATSYAQTNPAIAMDGSGNFVIAWESNGQDGSGNGIFAQHFNPSGLALGSEIVVNTTAAGDQVRPAVAMSVAGDAAIAWQGDDGSFEGIYAQRYEQELPPPLEFDDEVQVHTYTTGTQEHPSVGVGTSGDIVVVWQSLDQDGDGYGIFGQRYSAQGVAQGLEFRINSFTTGHQTLPIVSVNAQGGFIVVWQSADADGMGVWGKLYNNVGQPVSGDIQINSTITGNQAVPDVAMDPSGSFVVAWDSFGQDGDGYGIYARTFNLNGVPTGLEFQVNSITTGSQTAPAIAVDQNSNFVIAWESTHDQVTESGQGIYARRYGSNLVPVGTEFHVNTYTTNNQFEPDVAMDSEGNFVVVWTSSLQQGSTLSSIHFQRYDKLGGVQGGETYVDGGATVGGSTPAVAMDGAGNFTIVWRENENDANDEAMGILARRYNGDGTPRGLAQLVNTFTSANQIQPAVATNAIGDVAIVWTDETRGGTTDAGIFATRLEHLTSTIVTGNPPFQVNTFTTGNQFQSSIAYDSDGDFIVVWQSFNQTGTLELPGDLGYGIYAQRYDASGNRLGTEIHINSYTSGNQQNPVVAFGPGGSFVVAWQTNSFPGGNNFDIVARRFDGNAEPVSTEFMVNSFTTNIQRDPSLAIDATGDMVVVWRAFQQIAGGGYDIFARRYTSTASSDFAALGTEFLVNTITSANQNLPVVAMDSAGDFVVAWASYSLAQHFDIMARRYDFNGVPSSSSEFIVNQFTTNAQINPSIAMRPTGEFIIAWESNNQLANGPVVFSLPDIFARAYSATLDVNGNPTPVTPEFQVNTFTTGEQILPAVAMRANGDFVIAWASRFQDGDQYGIYAQRYNGSFVTTDGETQINVWTTGSQFNPAVAMDSNGEFTVTWQSTGGQDGNLAGVFGRRYDLGGVNPQVLSKNFVWQNKDQRVEFIVNRNVSASLGTDDVILENLTTAQVVTGVVVNFDPVSNKIIITFPTAGEGGALPNGRYRLRLIGTGITDTDGNNIGPDQVIEFYFINGDANHDGLVDVLDLMALSSKWLQSSGFAYTVGDFDYNGFVDQHDLGILAQNWQVSLASLTMALPTPPVVTSPTPTGPPAPQPAPTPAPAPSRPATRTPTRITSSAPVASAPVVSSAPTETSIQPVAAPAPLPEPAPAIVQAETPSPTPAPAAAPEPAPIVAPAPASQPEPAPAIVQTESPQPAPVVSEQPPAPVVVVTTPAPTVVENHAPAPAPVPAAPVPAPEPVPPPAPVAPAPAPAPVQTSPFASGPVIQAEPQAPPKRSPSRTPVRTASLVDL